MYFPPLVLARKLRLTERDKTHNKRRYFPPYVGSGLLIHPCHPHWSRLSGGRFLLLVVQPQPSLLHESKLDDDGTDENMECGLWHPRGQWLCVF